MGRTMKNKIPDRWLEFIPCSIGPVSGTKFVCFKTPLSDDLCKNIRNKNKWFTVSNLVDRVSQMGGRLGLVIDLTATDRYYDSNDFESIGIEYNKIYCPGQEIDEREDLVQEFFQIVHSFLQKNQSEEKVWIGVHCTHGVNRTGYAVCRYMIDHMGFSSERALNEFKTARQHEIERQNYIDSLEFYERHPNRVPTQSSRTYMVNDSSNASSNVALVRTFSLEDRPPAADFFSISNDANETESINDVEFDFDMLVSPPLPSGHIE